MDSSGLESFHVSPSFAKRWAAITSGYLYVAVDKDEIVGDSSGMASCNVQ